MKLKKMLAIMLSCCLVGGVVPTTVRATETTEVSEESKISLPTNTVRPTDVKRVGELIYKGRTYYYDKDLWVIDPLKPGNTLKEYKGTDTCAEIPYGFTAVGSEAFYGDGLNQKGLDFITQVKLPESIEKLEDCAFRDCDGITEVYLPDSVKEISSGFSNCPNLKSVRFPKDCKNIGYWDGTAIESIEIPEGVESLESCAFYGCTKLKEIKLPASLKEIGAEAFGYCTSLESIVIPENVDSLGYLDRLDWDTTGNLIGGVFDGCTNLKSVVFKGNKINRLKCTFADCTSLETITIPEGVEILDGGTFQGCTSLKTVNLPNSLTIIDEYSFENCTSLQKITLPDSVEFIRDKAFAGCTALTEMNVPTSLRYISIESVKDTQWYQNNKNEDADFETIGTVLVDMKSTTPVSGGVLTIPEGITSITTLSYFNTNVKSLVLPSTLKSISNFDSTPSVTEIKGLDNVEYMEGYFLENSPWFESQKTANPNLVIGKVYYDFYGTDGQVVIPENVVSYRKLSGYLDRPEGTGLFTGRTDIYNVSINSSNMDICDEMFTNCSNLSKITLADGIEYIGDYALGGTKLKEVKLPNGLKELGDYSLAELELTEIDLPSSLRVIGDYALSRTNLKELVVPEGVIELGYLHECSELENISLPSTLKSLGGIRNTSIKTLVVPDSVISITYTLKNVNMEYVKLPKNMKELPSGILEGCESLKEVILPENLEVLPFSCFSHCTNLKTVTIPNTVKEIEDGAFIKSGIETITIPDSVEVIDRFAFADCKSLTNINLPSSLEAIGSKAFENCTSLKSITIPKSVESVIKTAFDGCDGIAINVEAGGNGWHENWRGYDVENETITVIGQTTSTPSPSETKAPSTTTTTAPPVSSNPETNTTAPTTSKEPATNSANPSASTNPTASSNPSASTNPTSAPVGTDSNNVQYGDSDMNGTISLADAQRALKVALKIETASEEEIRVMSGGKDSVTLANAQTILKLALKIQSSYYPE